MATLLQRLKCNQSRWKSVLFLLLLVAVLLYFLAPYTRSTTFAGRRSSCHEKLDRCLEDKVRAHTTGRELLDTVIYHHPHSVAGDQHFIPYTGNGYLGISLDDSRGLWVKGQRELRLPTDLNPLIYTAIVGYETKVATILDLRAGIIYRYQCLCNPDASPTVAVQITHEVFAHRTRPGILVQDLRVYNPSAHDVPVSLIQSGFKEWTTAHLESDNKSLPPARESIWWRSSHKKLSLNDDESAAGQANSNSVSVGLAITPQLANDGTTLVQAGRTETLHLLSGFRRSGPLLPSVYDSYEAEDLRLSLIQELKAALRLTPVALKEEHVACWTKLWSSGFAISQSKAPDALNGDIINMTLYYVLSNVPSLSALSPSSDLVNLLTFKSSNGMITAASQESLLGLLAHPETCFSGPGDTLSISKLWAVASSVAELNGVVKSWLITLGKYGCSNYIRAGMDGVLQAMVLSMGRLRFSREHDSIAHLEMQMDPANLHRDLVFRRIIYGNASTLINISVTVGDDNRAMLRVNMDQAESDYYACDAECLSPSPSIKSLGVSLPVKVTQPVHPILYVTHNKGHMEELKHALHMDAKLAPAHDHQLIALHRHGYSYGGLPFTFWILLGSLLVIFHMFLFKLIYNECQQPQANSSSSAYYRRRADS